MSRELAARVAVTVAFLAFAALYLTPLGAGWGFRIWLQ